MKIDILTGEQIGLLTYLGAAPVIRERFYLTGGTPLAAFYLHHRYSEDLDFFSEHEIDIAGLTVLMNDMKRALKIRRIDFQQSFNRNLFFLHFKNVTVKIEFTYFPFPRIEQGEAQWGVPVDSIMDIAVNKLFTIYQRTQARDYIDLYCICKKEGYAVSDLIQRARIKFDWHIDPLQLGTQFVKAADAPDLPRMIENMPDKEWQSFFIEEAKKLGPEVIE